MIAFPMLFPMICIWAMIVIGIAGSVIDNNSNAAAVHGATVVIIAVATFMILVSIVAIMYSLMSSLASNMRASGFQRTDSNDSTDSTNLQTPLILNQALIQAQPKAFIRVTDHTGAVTGVASMV